MTGIAFIGTGFVADYYMTTLANHPDLQLVGCWDRDADRLAQFCAYYAIAPYSNRQHVFDDPAVEIVVNLTNPQSHFEINKLALEAGKHVYCEKPLAMQPDEATQLAALAKQNGLSLCSAPANALSPAFTHVADLISKGAIGKPIAAYAEMEDGPVHWDNWQEWKSVSGARWPGVHEFELGCTLEHAGYALSWLLALFGPVAKLSATASLVFPDKGPGTEHLTLGPDLTIGLLSFESGMTARVTCGLVSERKRSLTLMGEEGVLIVRDLWDNQSPVSLVEKNGAKPFMSRVLGKVERTRKQALPISMMPGRVIPYSSQGAAASLAGYPSKIDFAGGIARQADHLKGADTPIFSDQVAVHMTELTLALNRGDADYRPQSSF